MWWTRDQVKSLKALGVDTFGLMIGNYLPSDDDMNRMFLSNKNWSKVPRDKLLEETTKFIKNKFISQMKK